MSMYDAIIIGGGPAGITAALYMVRSGCKVALVEKLTPGGQVLQTEAIENYPGFPKGIKGWELADAFAAHLDDLELDRFTEAVESIELGLTDSDNKPMHKVLIGKEWHETRTIVLCSGSKHRHLGVENEMKYTGHGVSYCAICDGNFYRGLEVAVVGGGNTALEETLYLSKIVKKVHLIHRRDEFRGAKIYVDRLNATENVEIILDTTVSAIHGDTNLTGLTLKNVKNGQESNLNVDGFFVFVGNLPNADFMPEAVAKDDGGFIVTDTEMRTNVAGVFAAGDIRSKHCRQVSTAVGDGATAAQAAFLYVEQI